MWVPALAGVTVLDLRDGVAVGVVSNRHVPVPPRQHEDVHIRGLDVLPASLDRPAALGDVLLHADDVVPHPAQRAVHGGSVRTEVTVGRGDVDLHECTPCVLVGRRGAEGSRPARRARTAILHARIRRKDGFGALMLALTRTMSRATAFAGGRTVADQVLVFISHTAAMRQYPEGTSFVDGALDAVNAIDRAKAFHMAYFPAADMTPADYSVQQLSKANLSVAIIGFDQGSLVRGESRSYTELEFDEATRLRLPRLVFLLKPEAAHLQGLSTREARREQLEFRTKLEESGATVAYFGSVDDLKYKVQAALTQWLAAQQAQQPRPTAPVVPYRPQPPSAVGARPGAIAASGCLVVVLAVASVGLLAWTGLAASFPPRAPKGQCEGVSITVVDSAPSDAGTQGASSRSTSRTRRTARSTSQPATP